MFSSEHIPVDISVTPLPSNIQQEDFLGNYRTKELSLKDVTEELGFEVIQWDGKKASAICDSKNRIAVILACEPMDSGSNVSYMSATGEVYQALKREAQANPAIRKPQFHRQGTLWKHYSDPLQMIMKGNTSLEKPLSGSVYPCSTFNFGPEVWTYIH
jgi:hypothetical protein